MTNDDHHSYANNPRENTDVIHMHM